LKLNSIFKVSFVLIASTFLNFGCETNTLEQDSILAKNETKKDRNSIEIDSVSKIDSTITECVYGFKNISVLSELEDVKNGKIETRNQYRMGNLNVIYI
jgi:hypothetical protein